MNIYLFQSILNIIWTIFSIIFVLYRFTSFFSYIYNFLKFFGKIFTFIKDKLKFVTNRNEYVQRDPDRPVREPFFTRFKKGIYYIYGGQPTPAVEENSILFESHGLQGLHDSRGLQGLHGLHGLHDSRGLHDSHGLHDSRASHTTTWLNGDPNQISYSALRNTEDIDLITMDPFAEDQEFRSVHFV